MHGAIKHTKQRKERVNSECLLFSIRGDGGGGLILQHYIKKKKEKEKGWNTMAKLKDAHEHKNKQERERKIEVDIFYSVPYSDLQYYNIYKFSI